MTDAPTTPPARVVPAVDRAARILAMLEDERRPLSISEFASRLNASKGTVREVLETLRYHGFVERDAESKLYTLGARLIRLGALARSRLGLGETARPYLRELAEEVGEAAVLLLPQGASLIINEKAEPERRALPMTVAATIGGSIPLFAGACGKVMLAFDGPRARLAAGGGVVPDVPAEELRLVRARGFALDDQEFLDGIRGVSAPVFDQDGSLAALILVSGLVASIGSEQLEEMGEATGRAARQISAALGAPPREEDLDESMLSN